MDVQDVQHPIVASYLKYEEVMQDAFSDLSYRITETFHGFNFSAQLQAANDNVLTIKFVDSLSNLQVTMKIEVDDLMDALCKCGKPSAPMLEFIGACREAIVH